MGRADRTGFWLCHRTSGLNGYVRTYRCIAAFMRGNPYAALHGCDPGVSEDLVECGRGLAVPIPDEVLHPVSGIFEVHHEVASKLGHPGSGRVAGRVENAHAAAGV